MKWDSKHVRQKHFRFYVLAICRVLPKHNAQRSSQEGRDWTFIWIEQKALSSLQNCVHIYIHNRHDRSLRDCFLCINRCVANIYTNSGYTCIYDLCHWSITGNEFVKKQTFLRVKLFFLDFTYSGRPWREAFRLYDSKSQNRATYLFLNKTWSLSPNLKSNGSLTNKQDKNLPLSL